MYKQGGAGGGAGLDRKRISDALDKHLEKAVASPSTSRGSAGGGGGRDHHRLVVPSSVSTILKGHCSEGDVTRSSQFQFQVPRRGLVACGESVPILVRS
jgi:casein kinase II subunit beta